MKITLRQARRVEREIAAELQLAENGMTSHSIRGAIEISKYEDFAEKLDALQKDSLQTLYTSTELIRIRFGIRKAIETVNETSGINTLMNQEAQLRARAKVLTGLMTPEVTESELKVLQAKHKALQEAPVSTANSMYGANDTISLRSTNSTGMMDLLRDHAASVQRDLLRIVDELSSKNVTNSIELSNTDVEILKASRIIV